MKRITLISVAAIFLASCEETQSPTVPDAYLTLGSSAQRATAHTHSPNPHFFFLPPLALNTTFTGVFDGSLDPVVEICAWTGAECDGPPVAELTTDGLRSERIRVMRTHYSVNWHTNHSNLVAAEVYRIFVLVDGTVLGYVDVQMMMRVIGKKNKVRPDDLIRIRMGSTIPIRFRIEEGALPATGDLAVSNTTTGPDPDSDYTVTVDGTTSQPLLAGGTVTFSGLSAGDHTVELTGVASNCTVSGTNPRTVTVPAGGTAQTTFDVTCTALTITGVSWVCTGLITDAVGSDLWPITWSDDDNQYTAWGDGNGFQGTSRFGYGFAKLEGPPESYTATDLGEFSPGGDGGKVSGLMSISGVLYMMLNEQDGSPPTISLRKSTDKGQSVTAPIHQFTGSVTPLRFINHGRDNTNARDQYIYISGADRSTSDKLHLWRVPAADIETGTAWEVFSGTAAVPSWSTSLADRQPIYTATVVTVGNIIYNTALQKYILTVHHSASDLRIWSVHEGPDPWGPWTEIASYTTWCGFSGGIALPKFPSPKWINADGTEFWMVFSGRETWDRFNLIKGTFQLQ